MLHLNSFPAASSLIGDRFKLIASPARDIHFTELWWNLLLFHYYRRKWLSTVLSIIWAWYKEWCKNITAFIILLHHTCIISLFTPFNKNIVYAVVCAYTMIIRRSLLLHCRRYVHYDISPLYDTSIRSLSSILINDFTVKRSRHFTSFLGETWSKPHFMKCLSETFSTLNLLKKQTAKNMSYQDSKAAFTTHLIKLKRCMRYKFARCDINQITLLRNYIIFMLWMLIHLIQMIMFI